LTREENGLTFQFVVAPMRFTACVEHKPFHPVQLVITSQRRRMSRILKMNVQDIEKDRFSAAFEAYQDGQVHVLLKGYRSIIAYENREYESFMLEFRAGKGGHGRRANRNGRRLLAQGIGHTASRRDGRLSAWPPGG